MRRWFTRITVGVVALLVAIVVIVQIALWTNLPRRIVLGQLQQQLGLRVSADSLSTNWLGHTSLQNVTLSLPIAKDSFLTVPQMRVTHTSIPMLLLKRSVVVESITLDQPQLTVVRDSAGRWNFNEVADLIARTGGSENTPAPAAPPKLPKITADEATIVVKDTGGRTATVDHINLSGQPDGALVWRYDVSVPDHVTLKGQVVPGGEWRHQVDVTIKNIAPWIKPWANNVAENTTVAAAWDGRITDGSISGTLGLQEFNFGKIDAKGALIVRQVSGGPIALQPQKLVIKTGDPMLPEARFDSGRVIIDPTGARAEKLVFNTDEGSLRTDAGYTFASSSGDFHFAWEDLLIPSFGIRQFGGTLDGTITAALPDRPQISAKLITRGMTPDGAWDSTLAIDGAGKRGWSDMGWTVNADDLEWRGNYPISLDGLKAKLFTTPDPKTGKVILRVASLERPNHPAEATGEFDSETSKWKLYVSIGGLNATKAGGASALFMLNAFGDRDHVQLDQFLVRGPGAELWAKGTYVFKAPKPVDLDVYLNLPPNGVAMTPIDVVTTAPAVAASPTTMPAVAAAVPPISGWLRGELHLSGTGAAPRDLSVDGKLIGKNVAINGNPLGDIVAKVDGRIDNQTVMIATRRLKLLEGEWDLTGVYSGQTRGIDLDASVAALPLKAAGKIFHRTDVDGLADGKWKVHIPRFDPNVITIEGTLAARDVTVAGVGADRLEATISMDKGRVNVDPIKAFRKITRPSVSADGAVAAASGNGAQVASMMEKSVSGELTAAFHFAFATPKQMSGAISLKNWPQEIGTGAWFDISGGIPDLMVDAGAPPTPGVDATMPTYGIPPTLTLNGKPNFTADFSWRGQHIGKGAIDGTLLGREVELKTVSVESIHGNLRGGTTLNADYKLQSKAEFLFDNINAELLADLVPGAEGLTGMVSGKLKFEPSKDKRSVEPLVVTVNVDPLNARYRATDIGPIRLTAFTNLKRVVLSDPANVPSTIQIAGGVIELWGRLSTHDLQTPVPGAPKGAPSHDVFSSQMTIRLHDISLDQLVHTGAPEAKSMPGKLHAQLTLVASTRTGDMQIVTVNDPVKAKLERLSKSLIVEGDVRISDSNLANFSVFSALYGLMNIGQDMSKPTGSGDVAVRIEDGRMYLDNLRYFNAGTEVRAIASVDQIWMLPESKLTGTATGTARPLANMKLPFLADLDTILTVVQANVTNVAIDGSVHNPKVRPVTFDEIGTDLRAMVLGDAKK